MEKAPEPLKFRNWTNAVQAAKPIRKAGWNPSGRIASHIAERFLRRIFSVKVLLPSEWRHCKRGRVEPISAETRASQKVFRDIRIADNNRRIVDSRYHRDQAYGKMKRFRQKAEPRLTNFLEAVSQSPHNKARNGGSPVLTFLGLPVSRRSPQLFLDLGPLFCKVPEGYECGEIMTPKMRTAYDWLIVIGLLLAQINIYLSGHDIQELKQRAAALESTRALPSTERVRIFNGGLSQIHTQIHTRAPQ